MQLTSEEARDLSQRFRGLSVTLGDLRFSHWDELSPVQRESMENLEWSLLNASSDMITSAVGLDLDETEVSFQQLQESAAGAGRALQSLKTVQTVLNIATAAVGLAGAIVSRNPGAIAKSVAGVYTAVKESGA